MSEKPSIDIQSPSNDFQSHLNLPDNQRIFVSGPFGIGKTYFLKKFFEEREDKYAVIHLYPVNYSVAQNEDIFELIKYDVLYSLLNFPEIFEVFEIGTSIKASEFAKTKIPGLLSGFLNGFDHINKESFEQNTILQAIKLLVPMLEDYKRFSEETDKALSDFGLTDEFRKSIESKTGSIYENNIVTQLITKLIERLRKLAESEREVILIIDDLDRVDPDHIFRILNVFAAHFDTNQSENKFGFSKVVVVADYKNIQSIFQHEFGVDADFNGYVDKFYSEQVFFYDNRAAVRQWIYEGVQRKNDDNLFLENILLGLISTQKLTIRQVLKFDLKIQIGTLLKKESKNGFLGFYFLILRKFYSDSDALIEHIRTIDFSFPRDYKNEKDVDRVKHYIGVFCLEQLTEYYLKTTTKIEAKDGSYIIHVPGVTQEIKVRASNFPGEYILSEPLDYKTIEFWPLLAESFRALIYLKGY
ncbi:MAG: P-loop NTPase fold protein [Cyclobacteriaceae bacterium]